MRRRRPRGLALRYPQCLHSVEEGPVSTLKKGWDGPFALTTVQELVIAGPLGFIRVVTRTSPHPERTDQPEITFFFGLGFAIARVIDSRVVCDCAAARLLREKICAKHGASKRMARTVHKALPVDCVHSRYIYERAMDTVEAMMARSRKGGAH